jgi:hypothetical protein
MQSLDVIGSLGSRSVLRLLCTPYIWIVWHGQCMRRVHGMHVNQRHAHMCRTCDMCTLAQEPLSCSLFRPA